MSVWSYHYPHDYLPTAITRGWFLAESTAFFLSVMILMFLTPGLEINMYPYHQGSYIEQYILYGFSLQNREVLGSWERKGGLGWMRVVLVLRLNNGVRKKKHSHCGRGSDGGWGKIIMDIVWAG